METATPNTTVSVVLTVDRAIKQGLVGIHISEQLHWRPNDPEFRPDSGYKKDVRDSELLGPIITALFDGGHPITVIDVEPYELSIYVDKSADSQRIICDVVAAIDDAGYDVSYRRAAR